jgi:hypothetical protein
MFIDIYFIISYSKPILLFNWTSYSYCLRLSNLCHNLHKNNAHRLDFPICRQPKSEGAIIDTIFMYVFISYLVICLIMAISLFIWFFLKWFQQILD